MSKSLLTLRLFGRASVFGRAALLVALTAAGTAAEEPAAPAAAPSDETPAVAVDRAEETAAKLPWLNDLADAERQAREQGRLLLVRFGSESCGFCARLAVELESDEVVGELQQWIRVYLDADRQPAAARRFAVQAVPALRVLTPLGEELASRDGFAPAAELGDWLRERRDEWQALFPASLTNGETAEADLDELVQLASARQTAVREAAARRLLALRQQVAGRMVDQLFSERLAARLTALELLRAWSAPVADIDPWRGETLTVAAHDALKQWAEAEAAKAPTDENAKLSDERRAEAQAELELLTGAELTQAALALERLAGWGAALLPEVEARLSASPSEAAEGRLRALRYRLLASAALSASWSSGFERLASPDSATRRQAAEELSQKSRSDDHPLLLDLLNHTDPRVREAALGGLQTSGGERATAELQRLLDDPDPNVRAAFLKRLIAKPSPRLLDAVIARLRVETDSDLLGYGVRVLGATGGSKAALALVALLDSKQWQVRAEAAEALGKCLRSYSQSQVDDDTKATAYAAMIEHLDDEDAFVVGRLSEALQGGDLLAVAVEPLVAAALRHPDLAEQTLGLFAANTMTHAPATPRLLKLLDDELPNIRAHALAALARIVPADLGEAVARALGDSSAQVRLVAAKSVPLVLERELNRRLRLEIAGRAEPAEPGDDEADTQPPDDSPLEEPRLADLETLDPTTTRPQGVEDAEATPAEDAAAWKPLAVESLEKSLLEPDEELQLAAALALSALGYSADALPVIERIARTHPAHVVELAACLPWLPIADRTRLLDQFLELELPAEAILKLGDVSSTLNDPLLADRLWRATERRAYDHALSEAAQAALLKAYTSVDVFEIESVPASRRAKAFAAAKERLTGNSPLERAVALGILWILEPETAVEHARARLEELPKTPETLEQRRELLVILLTAGSASESRKIAIDAIQGDDVEMRTAALWYLALGREGLQQAFGTASVTALPIRLMVLQGSYSSNSDVGLPEPPRGLLAEPLRPILAEGGQQAALAGYLLALLGEAEGLPAVLEMWQEEEGEYSPWRKLTYRALAAVNDQRYSTVLEEMYETVKDTDDVKDFYWTIRGIDSPVVRALRKRIRTEVGMDSLR